MFEVDIICPLISFFLSTFVIWVYLHQLAFFFLSIFFVRRSMYRHVEPPPVCPGVSIVKPLMGLDARLRENLVSHFTIDYPKFEILFCVKDENDPVIDLVNSLRGEYPLVDSRLIIGGQPGIVNPMVDNMAPAYAAAKYELVWISTSRILASTPIMLDMVRKTLDPDVALVHQSPFFADQPGLLGALEKICFGCSITRNQVALNQLGLVCFVGMSYILKKSMLDDIGGLAYYGKYLAEDYFLSNKLHEQGYRVVLSDYPALQNVSTGTLNTYINRMVRWLRLRLRMLPLVAGLLEPCSEAVTVGVLFALSVNYLFDVPFFYLVLGHFIIWLALDYTLLRLVQHGPLPLSVPKFLLVWLFREMLVYVIFLKAISNPSAITWGKYSYHVKMGGLTTRMAPSSALRDLPEANACPTRVDFNKPGNAYAHVASNDRFTCVVNEDPSAIPLNSFTSDLPKNHLDV